jgi:hypothetical protein
VTARLFDRLDDRETIDLFAPLQLVLQHLSAPWRHGDFLIWHILDPVVFTD